MACCESQMQQESDGSQVEQLDFDRQGESSVKVFPLVLTREAAPIPFSPRWGRQCSLLLSSSLLALFLRYGRFQKESNPLWLTLWCVTTGWKPKVGIETSLQTWAMTCITVWRKGLPFSFGHLQTLHCCLTWSQAFWKTYLRIFKYFTRNKFLCSFTDLDSL